MYLKKVGKVVMFLGIAILLYGGIQALSIIPENIPPNRVYFDNIFSRTYQERERESASRYEKQDEAVKILIVGGIVTVRDSSSRSH